MFFCCFFAKFKVNFLESDYLLAIFSNDSHWTMMVSNHSMAPLLKYLIIN